MTTRHPATRLRDVIVDGDDTVDVTHVRDRDLVLRAVNSALKTEHALGKVAGELSGVGTKLAGQAATIDALRETIEAHTEALKTLGVRVSKAEGTREKMPSAHDIRELVGLVEDVKDEITGRHTLPSTLVTKEHVELTLTKRELDAARASGARWWQIATIGVGVVASVTSGLLLWSLTRPH